jgi:hypothetical protein
MEGDKKGGEKLEGDEKMESVTKEDFVKKVN